MKREKSHERSGKRVHVGIVRKGRARGPVASRTEIFPDAEAEAYAKAFMKAKEQALAEAKEEAFAKAKVRAMADSLLVLFECVGLVPTATEKRRVLGCKDEAQLEAWIRACVTAPSVEAILAHGPRASSGARSGVEGERARQPKTPRPAGGRSGLEAGSVSGKTRRARMRA